MTNAWITTHGAKCIKHTTNDQMSHEMPFKKLIWKFSLISRWYFAGKFYSWNNRGILCVKLKNLRIWPFSSQLSLYMKQETRKTLRTQVFHTKTTWKNLKKHGWYKSLPKTNKKNKKSFWFNPHMVEHTHITFEHVQSHKRKRYSLNIRLVCCVCVSNVE